MGSPGSVNAKLSPKIEVRAVAAAALKVLCPEGEKGMERIIPFGKGEKGTERIIPFGSAPPFRRPALRIARFC